MTTMPTIRPTLVDYLDQLLAIASAIHQCECVMRDARDARREAVHAFWNSDDADERAEHEHERGALDEYLTEQRANMALLYREKARLDRVLCTLNGCPADAPRRACPTIAS